jgi:hypothetical protein
MEPSHNDYQELNSRMAACHIFGGGRRRVPHHIKTAAGGSTAADIGNRLRRTAQPRRETELFGRHGKHVR